MDEIIVENIGGEVANGMAVYDATGAKIGTVQQYDLTNGWFQTEKGFFFPRDCYVPFSAINRIGPTGIYLNVTKEYVKDTYNKPPLVDVDVVAGPAGAAAVGTVSSGYDGSRVVVDGTTISAVIGRLDNGLKVYDSTGDQVGRLYQYVPSSDWIVVEKGVFSSKDLFIPVTAVAYLDNDGAHLRVPKDVLKEAFVVKPVAVEAVDAAAGAVAVDVVSNGYDSGRVIVDGATISLAIDRLGKGPKVYDADGVEIGRVGQYDPSTGWIVVEKGHLAPKDLFIPVTAVAYLDNEGVHLRVTKDVLQDAFVVKPANVAFVTVIE
jgi:hypothetical protein